jgi:hypothetical protein
LPLLLTFAKSHNPAAAPQLLAARSDSPALQWFSNQTAPVDIKVSGVKLVAEGGARLIRPLFAGLRSVALSFGWEPVQVLCKISERKVKSFRFFAFDRERTCLAFCDSPPTLEVRPSNKVAKLNF